MDLSSYSFSLLRAGDLTLYRGSGSDVAPALIVTAENPVLECLKRLEHEYALRGELDAAWAAKPVALSRFNGRLTLVLEDPGGEPLDRLLGKPLEPTAFLRIGVRIANAIRRAHERGFIHKDIKPANILVEVARGGAWLTGFGIASRLPRERANPEPPDEIAGTLAYMAPEQTGRMNRSIDSRSDLYSLGITFYEMLTGMLPFTAADPLECIHCHIARQPMPPDERISAVPATLSAIVMKLLAKTPEERYQTAAGVEADLWHCLAQWESYGRIDAFQLGAHDASDRLVIPERLYGREREIEALLASFDRVVAHGTAELVLLSGYSGIGKSSVVNELHKVLVAPRGLFASGKFDQYKRDIPYITLAQALESLVRSLLSQGEVELGRWRDSFIEVLGSNGQLIANLVPELELIIGKQPAVPDLPPQEAKNRFQMVFRRFLGVFARQEHPLALFLDDLQWLDSATLDLLEHLATHSEVRHLLLIGAYRDSEVGPSHPLIRTLESIREADANVHEIVLAPLGLDDIGRLIADALHCEPEHARPLVQLVQDKTGGNPFFAIQFLIALADEGLLAFDSVAALWTWDINRIRAKNYTDNVVDLMVRKLKRLSLTTQDALKHLACLGNMAEIGTLALIQSDSEEATCEKLWEAVHAGLVVLQSNVYQFLHDRIQQAAYSLFPEDSRPAVHLRIGRTLLANMTAEELTEQLFEVANQFNRGAALIVDGDEKIRVATINLRAGRKAKASAAYASARAYLASGTALVDERDWSSQYELTFNLWLERAQCELLNGNFERAQQLIAELLQCAASKVDHAAVYDLKARLHTVQGEYPQAVDNALICLRLFGVGPPAHPSREEVQAEYETVWRNLNGRSIESLIDLPQMTDPELLAAMQVFSILAEVSWFTDFRFYCMLVCRMVNISMQHGMSGPSAHGYACLGSMLGPAFHRYREGYRLARLACDLVEKHGFTAYQTKVYHDLAAVSLWTQPITSAIELRRSVTRSATETGNLTYACYSMHQSITGVLLRNDPLDAVWRESEMALDFVRRAKFRDVADLIVSQQRFIAAMQGRTATFSTFSDSQFDEATFEAQLTGDRMNTMICLYWILKLKARFLSGDYAEALAAAGKAKPALSGEPTQIFLLDYFYYTALAVAALYENASADEQAGWRALLAAHREQLREWAENYPPTFGDKDALVSGEIARLEGRDAEAMRLYEQAIKSARDNGFVQNEGLALEVAAQFYAASGVESIRQAYLRDARDCYLRWGALGKVRQLDQRYPWLREEAAPSARGATVSAPAEQLDVGTVVKASQAVSSEIELGKLIETLMRISLEHAGAERGLLILFTGNEPRIAAEATTGGGDIAVTLRNSVVTPTDLSESVLNTAVRTRDSVILDDASAQVPFSADGYVRQKHARSVLCLPLVKQAKLVGALYLENNLAPRVFTSAKLAVLQLLASQAAISLENVQLYDELRRSEAYLAEAQNLSHTGSFSWNTVSGRVYWSNETFRILEYDRSTVPSIDLLLRNRVHPEDVASLSQAIERASPTAEGVSQEFRLCLPGGRVKHIHAVAQGTRNESGEIELLGAVMDITASKQAEEKIRHSERELRVTIDTLPAFVLRSQPDGTVDFVSQSILDYSGLSEDAWVGRGWIDAVHPEDAECGLIEWSAAVARGAALGMELRFRRADGHYRWFESRSVPLRDESGDIVKWYWTIHDIDDRKRVEAEKERLRDQLRQSQKMEAIGTLAGGIAHDFNNILGAILGYGELAQQAVPAHSDVHRYVKNVMQAGGRAKALVERILAFSRRGTSEIGPINVQAVVHETLELLEATSLAPSVQIARHLDAPDAAIIGDATQLHQVVMNLCTNALQAMKNGGMLEVSLDRAYVAQGIRLSHGAVAAGSFVRLSVADTGSGIPEHVLDRMFDPFFTTKSIGEGTGLGLSLVHGGVADLGGAIDVRTVIGNGTTFTIWLPRAGEVVASAAGPTTRLPRGNGETVLVVDNEKALVALAEEILAELGYEPIGFSSSIVALGAFRESPQRFDIVLTDEWMPELLGIDLAREIEPLRPDLPIVLMSGSSSVQLHERARDAGIRELLRKPLQRKDIAECFRRVLHGSANSQLPS